MADKTVVQKKKGVYGGPEPSGKLIGMNKKMQY